MIQTKRILLITENLGSGGAERQLVGLAAFLLKKGYIVKVITYYKNQFFESFLKEQGVDYEFLVGAFDKKRRFFVINKAIKDFYPDTVISYLPIPNIIMCILKAMHKFRLIVSERSYTQHWGLETFVRFHFYRMADVVVCNSFSEEENVIRHYKFLKKKMKTIPNFVDTKRNIPKGKDIKVLNKAKILSVGRIIPNKNVLRALEAVRILKNEGYDFEMTWIGSCRDTCYVASVKECILKNGLDGIVHILDQQDNLLPYYQEATFFFFPSLLEGYPNVICEAMSCGLPVVCSNVCEMPKIIKNEINGFLFDPRDVKDMVSALERMLCVDKDTFRRIEDINRKQVVLKNSQDSFVKQYVNII